MLLKDIRGKRYRKTGKIYNVERHSKAFLAHGQAIQNDLPMKLMTIKKPDFIIHNQGELLEIINFTF